MLKMDTRRVTIALFLSAAFLLSGSAAQAENYRSGFTTSDHNRGQGAGRFESAAYTTVCEHSDKNQFASPRQKSKALKSKSDAQFAITRFLELSGFGKVDLVDPCESAYDFADIAWKAETFQGFAQINSVDEGGIEKALRIFIGNLASGCEEVFCSQIFESVTERNCKIQQFHTGCSLKDLNIYSAFTVMESREESILIGNDTVVDPEIVKKLNHNLRENILKTTNSK
jgi:hypothetical protein